MVRAGTLRFDGVPGANGLDFVALTSAALEFDYSGGINDAPFLEQPYFAFPSLVDAPGSIAVLEGRIDLRSRTSGSILVDGRNEHAGPFAMDLSGTLVVDDFVMRNTRATVAPVFTQQVATVVGALVIRDNPSLSSAEIQKLLLSFASINGTVVTCGNADDPPCE